MIKSACSPPPLFLYQHCLDQRGQTQLRDLLSGSSEQLLAPARPLTCNGCQHYATPANPLQLPSHHLTCSSCWSPMTMSVIAARTLYPIAMALMLLACAMSAISFGNSSYLRG